jgi:subtilisin family serine protease
MATANETINPAADSAHGFQTTDIAVQMDPRLQHVLARRSRGILAEATASTEVDEISVIAKVTDPAKWEGLSEVRAGTTIGNPDPKDKTSIVTGRIPAVRIEAVRQMGFVKSLKAAQALKPALAAGVEETKARPDLLPAGALSNGGTGVVVGIVDYGCDFAHRNFVTSAGQTRLLSIWHQGGSTTPTSPSGYGREYIASEINAALTHADPYTALGYGPARDTPTSRGTHGTHVMDIAAGNGAGSGASGFAPEADLVFVDVSHADIPFGGSEVVGSSFGDSTRLLEAIRYIFEKAAGRPCVINISLGTNGGPHDGTTLVEQGIDRLLEAQPNRAVTIAASNSFADGIHAQGTVAQGQHADLAWLIPAGDFSHNEFECWYSAADQISLELIDPAGQSMGVLAPGQNGSVTGANGAVQVFAANRPSDPNNGDNMIGVFLDRTAASGAWTVRLHGTNISSGAFQAWIERDNAMPSKFAEPHDNRFTIGSISCGRLALTVGSYDAHKPQRPISWFSSAGPTRDGREKPEISGPGHGVFAAHSRTTTGVVSKSGTSMAAPAVAGIVALMLGEARARGLALTVKDIRDIVIASARRNPPAGANWDERYGHGRIDASNAINQIMQLAPAAAPPQPAAALVTGDTRARSGFGRRLIRVRPGGAEAGGRGAKRKPVKRKTVKRKAVKQRGIRRKKR